MSYMTMQMYWTIAKAEYREKPQNRQQQFCGVWNCISILGFAFFTAAHRYTVNYSVQRATTLSLPKPFFPYLAA
jgi:hypothetical protein